MIPDYQTLMLPLLQLLSDGRERSTRETINALSDRFGLDEEERFQLLDSGSQPIIDNRVGWARTYLKKANLLINQKRGRLRISEQGLRLLERRPERVDVAFLKTLPQFSEWHSASAIKTQTEAIEAVEEETIKTPQELLDYSIASLRNQLAIDLLDRIKEASPASFERLVVDLLLKMGYGGSIKEAGQVKGRAGDGGIDGTIKEDKLGLDMIYIQAKRWEGQVSIHQVRDFAGALLAHKARKGVFITTSDFPSSAHDYVKNIDMRVVLINGVQLAELMIEHNVGVALEKAYEVKRLDGGYFDESD